MRYIRLQYSKSNRLSFGLYTAGSSHSFWLRGRYGSSTVSTVSVDFNMARLFISFDKQNLRIAADDWIFGRRQVMRFEWLALLALKRRTLPGDYAWVSLEEVAQLPSWKGRG